MKIGVTGSPGICAMIQKVLKKNMPDLELLCVSSEYYQDSVEVVEQFQKSDVNGILFTGPTNYNYVLKRLTPTVPWVYLPHNQSVLMKAFLQAIHRYNFIPDVISVDMYEEQMVLDTLEEAGITGGKVLKAYTSSPDERDFEANILRLHRFHYYEQGAKMIFTNMEHIYQPLIDEGIPCVRFSTTEDLIMEQIYALQTQNLSARENHGLIATVQIFFDFSFDDEKDLSIREWEKIHYQNEMKELIYAIAHRMDAAAFSEGSNVFYIMTMRRVLMEQFIQNGEYQKLILQGQKNLHNRIWIGIGIGSSPLEAKSRASMALNHSVADQSGSFYIAEDEYQVRGLEKIEPREHRTYLLQQLHLSSSTFARLEEILQEHDNQITSAELAEEMGITERSANRLILRLEQNNYVTTIGKISTGRGRPARILKIVLP